MAIDYVIRTKGAFSADEKAAPLKFKTLQQHDEKSGVFTLKGKASARWPEVALRFDSDNTLLASVTDAEGKAFRELVAFVKQLKLRHRGLEITLEGGGRDAGEDF